MWQYVEHFKYTVVHKYYVFVYCCKLGIPFRGIKHDISKFRLSEFVPYANYFFMPDGSRRKHHLPSEQPTKIQRTEFAEAWCHHTRRNDHHWNYWACDSHNSMDTDGVNFYRSVVEMPKDAVAELVCDMIGASAAQGFVNPETAAYLYFVDHACVEMHPQTYRDVIGLFQSIVVWGD